MTDASLVVSLVDALDVSCFGGKAATLAALIGDNRPVPGGLVIAAGALERHIAVLGFESIANSVLSGKIDAISPDVVDLRNALLDSPLDASLDNALVSGLQSESDKSQSRSAVKYVVRSSAVGEDGGAHSFAGQYLSVNDVSGIDEIRVAIRRVWASLFEPSAIDYAKNHDECIRQMAVVVQSQVDAQMSGVLFTRDPIQPGSNSLVIECCSGLATELVNGSVTPIRIESCHNLKLHYETDDSCEREFVERHTNALVDLVRAAITLEAERGTALDIEWCIDADGELQLVQCRPVTTLIHAPLEDWSNANINENYFEPVVPMLSSFIVRGYAGYFRSLARVFGVSQRRIASSADAFDGLVGLHAGRPYYNLSRIVTVLHLVPGGGWLASTFNLFTGARATPQPTRELNTTTLERVIDVGRALILLPWHAVRIERGILRFERRIDTYAAATTVDQLADTNTDTLAGFIEEFLTLREHEWRDAALSDASASISYAGLGVLLKRWTGNDAAAQRNALLQGLPGLASALPVEALWDIANELRQDSQLAESVCKTPDDEVHEFLVQHAPPIATRLDRWFSNWGFRYSGELLLTRPTPLEDPLPVIRLLKTYLTEAEIGPAEVSARRAAERLVMSKKVAHTLGNNYLNRTIRSIIFRTVLGATHRSIRWRERARMKQALLYTRLRLVCLALGERTTAIGLTKSSDDIFYLEIDEAITLARSLQSADSETIKLEDHTIQSLIAARRALHTQQLEQSVPPDEFKLPRGASWCGQTAHSEISVDASCSNNVLHGIPASAGEATGNAVVVLDVAQIDRVERGTILVTYQTDPGWAPIFFLTKGLVIERGGQLSHGAIIAREYGIPAVVGVVEATTRLLDGERLNVQGDAGRVERLDV